MVNGGLQGVSPGIPDLAIPTERCAKSGRVHGKCLTVMGMGGGIRQSRNDRDADVVDALAGAWTRAGKEE